MCSLIVELSPAELLFLVCFSSIPFSLVPICIYTQDFVIYIPYGSTIDTPAETAFLQILSNLVVLNTLVPISLYVRSVNVFILPQI